MAKGRLDWAAEKCRQKSSADFRRYGYSLGAERPQEDPQAVRGRRARRRQEGLNRILVECGLKKLPWD